MRASAMFNTSEIRLGGDNRCTLSASQLNFFFKTTFYFQSKIICYVILTIYNRHTIFFFFFLENRVASMDKLVSLLPSIYISRRL